MKRRGVARLALVVVGLAVAQALAAPAVHALEIIEFPIRTPVSYPRDPAPDGSVWFVAMTSDKVIRFDPATGQFEEQAGPSSFRGGPYAITVDGAGRVVYNEMETDTVVRFDPKTEKAEVGKSPSRGTAIRKMAVDAQGHVWYVGSSAKTVGFIK